MRSFIKRSRGDPLRETWRAPAVGGRRGARRRPALEVLEDRAVPATIAVTSMADLGDGSLRAAIEQANLDPDADTITFDTALVGTITLATPLPDLATAITIDGPGAASLTVARSAAEGTPEFRIFTVPTGAEVAIDGLTITRGRSGSDGGGGISNAGTLTVTNSTISANAAASGGGIYSAGTMTITNSTISANAAASGGGIYSAGTMTITNSTISANRASSGNAAASGGGIYNGSGSLTVTNSTLSGNETYYEFCMWMGTYIGMYCFHYAGIGGGIYNGSGSLTVTASLFANGSGGNLVQSTNGTFTSLGHNLFSDNPAVTLDPSDLVNTDPKLGPLADHGGPTFTHALLPGSPAIDAGVAVPGVTTDQRGIARPQGSAPDIGAFETRGQILVVTSTANAGDGTLRAAIEQANLDPDPDAITFAPSAYGTITLATALPDLATPIIIDGPGANALTVARSAATGTPEFRIFTVPTGAEVAIDGLIITGGRTVGGGGGGGGGGIYNSGTLTVTGCTINGNSAFNGGIGGGIYNAGTLTITESTLSSNSGGGIYNTGWLTITQSTLSGNSCGGISNTGWLEITQSTLSSNSGGGIYYNTGWLTITQSTLSGNSGGGISNTGTLTVTESTLSGNSGGGISNTGTLTVTESTLSGNSAFYGGGIYNEGTATVNNSTISGNSAFNGGIGGGIYNAGTATVNNSTISGNSAFNGGGIYNQRGRLTLNSSTLSGNLASARGGGISNSSGTLDIIATTVSGNGAGLAGGGIYSETSVDGPATLYVRDSTLTDNWSTYGGGINNYYGLATVTRSTLSGNAGAGINNTGTLTVSETTLSGNWGSSAGGLSNGAGTATVIQSTISGNAGGGIRNAAMLAVTSSTLSGNWAESGGGINNTGMATVIQSTLSGNAGGGVRNDGRFIVLASILANPESGNVQLGTAEGMAFDSLGHNLFSDTPTITLHATDLTNTNPYLGPLAYNGGPTMTHALPPGSPAIDAGVAVPGVTTDQRGWTRTQCMAPDIGACESPYYKPPVVTSVVRTGSGRQPTRLVLTFSTPLDPARASNPANYELIAVGPNGRTAPRARPIAIASAVYDAATRTVTLAPKQPLGLMNLYRLTVRGAGTTGVCAPDGTPLDGSGTHRPGTDFVTVVHGFTPYPKAPVKPLPRGPLGMKGVIAIR